MLPCGHKDECAIEHGDCFQCEILRLRAERDAALADNAALLDMLNRLSDKWGSAFKASLGMRVANDHEDLVAFGSKLGRMLNAEHPGTALLAHVAQLEAVAAAANEYIEISVPVNGLPENHRAKKLVDALAALKE